MSSNQPYNSSQIPYDIENQNLKPKLTIRTDNLKELVYPDLSATIPAPIQSQKITVKPIDTSASSCCIIFCAMLVIAIFCLPFVICDLYFAYNDISCQYDSNPVGITLSTWLKTSGFVVTGYLILFLVLVQYSLNNECNKFLLNVIKYIFSGFLLAWIIVGSVIFWKYLEPSGTCNKTISDYMWVRLIIGLVGIYFNSRTSTEKK
jgi:hypothetical protein